MPDPPSPPILQSIRQALIGAVSDFVHHAGFRQHEINMVVDFVHLLSEYREEEIPFFPEVYLVEGAGDSDVLATIAPGMEQITIGEVPATTAVAGKVLKDCGALANESWSIFLASTSETVRYGLFRSHELPFSISADESLRDIEFKVGAAILIRNCSARCVEMISGNGQRMELSLTSTQPPITSVSTQISELARVVVSTAEEVHRDSLRVYFERILTQICRQSHGTIIVVISGELAKPPAELCDGVVLTSSVKFQEAAKTLASVGNAPSLSTLLAREALLRGMISSDGITVMGTDASIRAFRVFVKPSRAELDQIGTGGMGGGARSRAFELLRLRIGSPLECIFFRSQDGQTECVVNNA